MSLRVSLLSVMMLTLGACTIEGLALTGKACPCAEGLQCDPTSNTCFPTGVLDFSFVSPDLTLGTNAELASLGVSAGMLSPAFSTSTLDYTVDVSLPVTSVTLTPTSAAADALVLVDGAQVTSGTASLPIDVTGPLRTVKVSVIAPAGNTTVYSVLLRRSHYVKASNTRAAGAFSVTALSGDTLVVGAPGESSCATGVNGNQADTGCPEAGAVYVFVRSGGTWAQQAYLKASNTNGQQRFGEFLAIDHDTIAVGATGEASCATGVGASQASTACDSAGAVYVFTRSGTTWTQQAYLKPSRLSVAEFFGTALSLSGDTLAVGATGDAACTSAGSDNNCLSAGAVFVFVRSGANWTQQAYLKPATVFEQMDFGWSVALQLDTLAVGGPSHTGCGVGIGASQARESCPYNGAAWVFTRSGETWTQRQFFKSDGVKMTGFGASLAIDGDLLLVGEWHFVRGRRCHVFKGGGAAWMNDDVLESGSGAAGETLASVALSGARAILGTGNTSGGAAYAFERGASGWLPIASLRASNAEVGDAFGISVTISEGMVAVGAAGESSSAVGVDGDQADNATQGAGAVYLYPWP